MAATLVAPALRRLCGIGLAALLAASASSEAAAQLRVPRSVEGRVTDTGGVPVVAAAVRLESLQPPSVRNALTDSVGVFRFDEPGGTGEYVLDVITEGYRPIRRRIGNDGGRVILRADVRLRSSTQVLPAVRVVAGPPPPPKPFEFAIGVGGTEAAAGGTRAASGPALGTFLDALRTNLMTDASGLLGLPEAESQTQLNGLLFRGTGLPRSTPVSIKAGVGEYDISIGGYSGGRIAVDLMQAGEFSRRSGEVTVADDGSSAEWSRRDAASNDWPTVIIDAGGTSRLGERGGVSWGARAARSALPSLSLVTADTAYLADLGVTRDLLARTEALARARALWSPSGALSSPDMRSTSAIVRLDARVASERTSAFVLSGQRTESAPSVTSIVSAPAQARGQRTIDITAQHLFRALDPSNAAWDVRTGVTAARHQDLRIAGIAAPTVIAQARDAAFDTAFSPAFILGGVAPTPQTRRVSTEVVVRRDRLSRVEGSAQTQFHGAARIDAYRADATGASALLEVPSLDALERLDAGAVHIARASGARAVAQRFSLGASRTRRLGDVLRVTAGLRADHQRVTSNRGLHATSLDFSPRVGLTWNFATPDEGPGYMESNLETRQLVPPGVLRVGAGVFVADLTPEQVASPAGAPRDASSVNCLLEGLALTATDALAPDRLEAGCLSSGAEAAPRVMRSTSSLAAGFRPPRSIRATLSTVTRWRLWDITLDGIIARNDRQPVVRDAAVPREPVGALAGDGGRPLFAPLSMFDDADGRLRPGRIVDGVATGRAIVVSSDGSSFLRRLALQIGTRNGLRLQMRGGYVWSSLISREGGWDRDAFESPWVLERGPSAATSRHQLQFEIARSFFGVTASAWMRAASGTPFTPLVAGDVNGDGVAHNDRAVIPADARSPEYAALLNEAPDYARRCLLRHAGRVAPRGSCSGPASLRSALYFSVDPGIYLERKLAEVVVVLENPFSSTGSTRVDPMLFRVQHVDRAQGSFGLSVNPSFGRRLASGAFDGRRLSISVRIPLSKGIQRQQLDRWLASNGVGRGLRPDSLAALLARNVPNLYDGLLEDDDELGLLPTQRIELRKRRDALAADLRTVWQGAARELVDRGERRGSDAALAIVQRATNQAWEVSRVSANQLPDVITPVQESLLPAPANMLVRATQPIRMQVIYY